MTPDSDTANDIEAEASVRPDTDPYRVAFAVLICCTVLVALVSFALSFYGLNDYGYTVMRLPRWLSPLVPLGVDLFSLCGIAATYLLRRAPGRARAYSWLVFLVPTGLSVAGNLAHGESRALARAGLVGAAVAPVILALATHLVVVVRRHLETDTEPDAVVDMLDGLDVMPRWAEFEQVIPRSPVPFPEPEPDPEPAATPDTGSDSPQVRALTLLLDGGSVSEAAASVGVDPRTVQRWADRVVDRARPRKAAVRRAGPAASVNGQAREQ